MESNKLKQSGIGNLSAVMEKIESQKDAQKEAVDLKDLTVELRNVAGDVRYLIPKVEKLSAGVESTGKQLEEAGKAGETTLTKLQEKIKKMNEEGAKIGITDESMKAITDGYNNFQNKIIEQGTTLLAGQKTNFTSANKALLEGFQEKTDDFLREEKDSIRDHYYEISNLLSEHGVWFSPKVFWWLFGSWLLFLFISLMTIMLLCNGNLRYC